jgi:1-acyl-sn-glycerol-3-phosphate acyltransferase
MKVIRSLLWLLYQPYKWLFFIPFFFVNTLVFGIIAFLTAWLVDQYWGSYFGGVIWSRLNASLVPMIVKVEGRKNIKRGISYIVMPNHQSAFDIFLIYGWLGIDLKWVMKKELRKFPGLGFGADKVGHIFLDRSNSRAAVKSLEIARKRIVNGTCVVIFPEGTRSNDGIPIKFRRGGFKLALDLQLPVLPVTLINTRHVLPNNSLNLFPGRVKMVIHPPIEISDYSETDMQELITKTREKICSVLPEIPA